MSDRCNFAHTTCCESVGECPVDSGHSVVCRGVGLERFDYLPLGPITTPFVRAVRPNCSAGRKTRQKPPSPVGAFEFPRAIQTNANESKRSRMVVLRQ